MGNNQSYVEKTEQSQDEFGALSPFGNAPNPAKEMIKISDTNRVLISDKQAILLNLVGLHNNILANKAKSAEMKKLLREIAIDNHLNVQTAQLTRDSMSREDYIRCVVNVPKKKGLLDAFTGHKQASTSEGEITED